MLQAMWQTSLALAPFLLLGSAVAGLLHVVLPKDLLRAHLQGTSGVVKAVLFGVPLPLCSCGVIPAGLGLRRDGASRGSTVGFLISTPQTGVDSILVSGSMLGIPFALFKVASALVTGLVGGMLTEWLDPGEAQPAAACEISQVERYSKFRQAIDHALMILQSIWRWLVFGIVVSAAIDVLVPTRVWTAIAALDPAVTMLATLVISLPLYVCATASVPIASALVAGGLPAGAALVFLMAGPATNIATVGAVYRALGAKSLAIYLSTVILFSLGLGYAFDQVLPTASVMAGHVHGSTGLVSGATAVLLWGLLAYFAFDEARNVLHSRAVLVAAKSPMASPIIDLDVEGMTCQGCVKKLHRTLSEDARVEDASVTLSPQHIRVQGHVTEIEVEQLVSQAGYRVVHAP